MRDMGSYKCHFKNAKGEDETTGKVTVKPAPKSEEKKEPSPVADQQPAAPKKSFLAQKKEKAAPEPEKQEEAGDQFKLKKKSSVGPRKQLPAKEEEPAFGGFKLKKAETVKRQWDDGGLEGVNLKHHEFEKEPEVETPERNTDVLLGDGVPDKDDKDGKGKKKKKVPDPINKKENNPKLSFHEIMKFSLYFQGQRNLFLWPKKTNTLFFTLKPIFQLWYYYSFC
jgi:hypothetical protein